MKQEPNIHTLEEIDELKNWFEENKESIPTSMQINVSTYSPNLKQTIDILLEQAYTCYKNSKMQGCIILLKRIKDNIIESNK